MAALRKISIDTLRVMKFFASRHDDRLDEHIGWNGRAADGICAKWMEESTHLDKTQENGHHHPVSCCATVPEVSAWEKEALAHPRERLGKWSREGDKQERIAHRVSYTYATTVCHFRTQTKNAPPDERVKSSPKSPCVRQD